jgi:hypothetical protein
VKRALEAWELSSENVQLAAALADANERLRAENLYLRREVERKWSSASTPSTRSWARAPP